MEQTLLEKTVALRHQLHAHPELSGRERETQERLMAFLQENAPAVELFRRDGWFYGVYRGEPAGRRIAFRADMDALPIDETISLPYGSQTPGVSHKCGHDGHSATLAALAADISRTGCKNTVYFVFQPAEETGEGAMRCASLMDEEQVEEIFAWHNCPNAPEHTVLLRHGTEACASEGMSLYFHGAPSHASDPFLGRNPAFAIARLISALPALYRAEEQQGLVLATVVHVQVGEAAFGTSPGDGVLRVTLRAEREEELTRLRRRVDQLAYGLSAEYGLEYHAECCDRFPETRNHDESVDKVAAVCRQLGVPWTEMPFAERGSEDFGYFTQRTRGAYFLVGSGEGPAYHTTAFDFPDGIIPTALRILRALAETD